MNERAPAEPSVKLPRTRRGRGPAGALLAAAAVLGWAAPAEAHVTFSVPASGDMFAPGDKVTLAWSVIEHDTEGYDIDLAPMAGADSVAVVHGLAPDRRSYDWVIPSMSCDQCVLTITQQNKTVTDYSDSVPIAIGAHGSSAAPDAGGCRVAAGGATGSAGARGAWAWLAALGAGLTMRRRARRRSRAGGFVTARGSRR